jgi:hypothetical protein
MSTSLTPPPNPRLTAPFSKKDVDMALGKEGFFPTSQQEQAAQIVYRFVVGAKRVVHGCFKEFRK